MAGEYTLCNLDNHTYTSGYPTQQDQMPYGGGYGGGEYVNGGGLHQGPGPGPPNGGLELPPHGAMGPHMGYEQGGMCGEDAPPHSQAVYLHGEAQGHQNWSGGQHHYPPPPHQGRFYGSAGMGFNGGIADMPPVPHGLPQNGGYPLGYPDPTNCNPLLGTPNSSAPGYCLSPHDHVGLSSSPGSDQGPVTTYKWMTVKRGTPKTGKMT